MNRVLLLLGFLGVRVSAQIPDLDAFGGDFDLPSPPTPAPEAVPAQETLPRNLLVDLPSALTGINDVVMSAAEADTGALVSATLPGSRYLVVPNTARIDTAYARLAEAVADPAITPGFPLKVVLHADGNFSVAVQVEIDGAPTLPAGVDISPQPVSRVIGLVADIQLVEKRHPLVLNAFVDTRTRAQAAGMKVKTREFLFLPLEPGRVLFALETADAE